MNICRLSESLTQNATLIIPLFEGDLVPSDISKSLNYDLSSDLNLTLGKENVTFTMQKEITNKMVFLGLGKPEDLRRAELRKTIGSLVAKEENVCIWIDSLQNNVCDFHKAVFDVVYGIEYFSYEYAKENKKQVIYATDKDVVNEIEKALTMAKAINHARTLGNTPSNFMHPKEFADDAVALAKELGLDYEVLTNKELAELGAGAILAVNQGSAHEARLITIWYHGNGNEPYTALVGKGITFDAGGYNLKKASSMSGMKLDMCGAANVLGAFEYIARTKQKVNVMAVIAATENMVSATSYTCDNVITSLSGKTIEITNTDAEGRLILCDAITYAQRKGAKYIIDVATLTGAVVTALGKNYTGTFTNSSQFLEELNKAANYTEEKVWQLPLDEEMHNLITKSYVADMVNVIVDAKGGASLAAAFLEEFIENDTQWIHLDIAGTGDIKMDNGTKSATGAMVETLATMFTKQ
ncbi:leucyl aminopeptidase family protein [Erysipelotrichaceae bacterium HCN-30851]